MDHLHQQKRVIPLKNAILLLIYRFGHYILYHMDIPIVKQLMWVLYRILDVIYVQTILHAEFVAKCTIGKSLKLPHGGNGIIISPDTIIGDNVTIFHQVTIGRRCGSKKDTGSPVIGNNVLVGCGAKILGDIKVGDGAKIGANSVVLIDVPPNSTAIGIPAKIIDKKAQSSEKVLNGIN